MSILGIDIGGRRIKAATVDSDGHIIAKQVIETPTNVESFKDAFVKIVREVADTPTGVGIGCKGVLDTTTGTVLRQPGTFSFLEGLNFPDLIASIFGEGMPVVVDNDARVALAGEVVWGAARGIKEAVMLTLGTGVGGAVLVDGKILRGAGGAAGLLGHITVSPNGRFCDCGNRGCLETIFSANAIEAEALHAIHRGCESSLTKQFASAPEKVTCKAVFDAAGEGDSIATSIRDEAIASLGAGIASLLYVFDPEVVILGGQIVEAGDSLLAPLRFEMDWRTRRYLGREVPLVTSMVEDKSGVVGAAALIKLK